jgi:two-component system, OmpR family, sensor histidine kinase KdpD
MSSSTPNSASTTSAGLSGNDPRPARGQLKLLLGYAAGVGKTYRMLEEAQHLKQQGKDVVVGYFEPHKRKDTIAKTEGLEMVPTKTINYRGVALQEMDTAAIQMRRPAICVVDELAHTNVPGSERYKRWEDVQVLLDSGIDVMTNMNIQHLESLNDQIFHITGIRVRETVPDWFVKSADEVLMVDATTGALLNRLKRGDIYALEKAQKAMENFFKESNLAALRELALRQTAHELELREFAENPEIAREILPASPSSQKQVRDRILIYLTPEPSTSMLIRRGRRRADYLGADCFAVSVSRPNERRATEGREAIEKHLNFARNLHVETRKLEGNDPAEAIVDFARRNQITQILLGRPKHRSWSRLLGNDLILQIVRKAKDIRVIIVAERQHQHLPPAN